MYESDPICSVSEYVKIIEEIQLDDDSDRSLDLNSGFCFRGQNSSSYGLEPSIGRTYGGCVGLFRLFYEKSLIETALSRYPDLFGKYDCPFALLAKMQHYGIPTRLLDITTNALVALYFACESNSEDEKAADGEVIVFYAGFRSRYDGLVSAISDTYKLSPGAIDMDTFMSWLGQQPYMKSEVRVLSYPNDSELGKERIKRYFVSRLRQPVFVEPGYVSLRQQNQAGKFIIFPSEVIHIKTEDSASGKKKSFPAVSSENLRSMFKDHDKRIKKIIRIPCDRKEKIIFDLQRFGITREFLYPDDMDANCRSLAKEVNHIIGRL